jgi:predicted kinase
VSRTDEQSLKPEGQDVDGRRGGSDYRRAAQAPADRPRPYSYEDLNQRLERLPRGHPSSPYNADGSRKPPPPNLRALELPLPDEDPEDWAGYDTDGAYDGADYSGDGDHREAENARSIGDRLVEAKDQGLVTIDRYYDPRDKRWTTERQLLHRDLINDLYEHADHVPCERKAVMAGGLGGAGKSTVLEKHAGIDRSQYMTINPDDIKEEMAKRGLIPDVEGLSPMEASDLVHEESSYIAKRLARRAMDDGKNYIWDITMSSKDSAGTRLDDLDEAGYATTGIFVEIPIEESVRRADERHQRGSEAYLNGSGMGGRYVPPEVIRAQADPEWGSVNRRTFEEVKHRFVAWAVYDNSVYGRDPVLCASSGKIADIRDEI